MSYSTIAARTLSFAVLLIVAAALGSGCASTEKRLNRGIEAEEKGDYAAAVRRYVQVLRREPSEPTAREGLVRTGNALLDERLQNVERDREAGRFAEAAQVYESIDQLISDVQSVGVELELPTDYEAARRRTFNQAINQLLAEADAAENDGRWSDAMSAYDEIGNYGPTAAQEQRIEEARIRTHIRWAESDIAAGRYKSAVERADQAIALLGGPEARAARPALEVRRAAIEQGTVFAAMTEFWIDSELPDEAVPTDFLEDLNDVLQLDFWAVPPIFIATADPIQVRREVRSRGYSRSEMTPTEAARVGSTVDADFVVIGLVSEFKVAEDEVRRNTRNAETNDGAAVTYSVESGRLTYDVEVAYEVVDTRRRRVVERGRISERERGNYERAFYDGDSDDLDLSRSERRLFDEDRLEDQERALLERIVQDLTPRVAEAIYDDLLRQVD